MSTLIMVRHGQASFGATNYDKLSETGIAQSVRLGRWWAGRDQQLDAAFTGTQERQIHTLKAAREVCQKAGLDFPEGEVWEAFNEYDAQGIMTCFLPELVESEPRLKAIIESGSGMDVNSPEGRRNFQQVFEIVMNRWLKGEMAAEGVESWEQFKNRVVGGVKRIQEEYPSGKTVAVFTSGGPVSAFLQYALQMPVSVALDLGWVIKNAALTEFKYNRERFTLTGFNMIPHISDKGLVTLR